MRGFDATVSVLTLNDLPAWRGDFRANSADDGTAKPCATLADVAGVREDVAILGSSDLPSRRDDSSANSADDGTAKPCATSADVAGVREDDGTAKSRATSADIAGVLEDVAILGSSDLPSWRDDSSANPADHGATKFSPAWMIR